MALKEQDVVFTGKDVNGNTVIQMPITRVENVEGAVKYVNKVGPDEIGNVTIEYPVTSVNGKTGDVTLRFAPSGSPISVSATPGNNSNWTYTTTTDGYLAISARAGTGRSSSYVSGDEGAVGDYVYSNAGSTSLLVNVGSETLCNKSSSQASTSFSKTNHYVAKGTVITVKCYRSYSSNAVSHSVSLTIDPYALS